jgi:hypothetical protein
MSAVQVAPPLFWEKPLSFEITPKSGPVRRLVTLLDARSAMVHDLPPRSTRKPHWLRAGMLIVAASESGAYSDIRAATEAMADALDTEGWMSTETANS